MAGEARGTPTVQNAETTKDYIARSLGLATDRSFVFGPLTDMEPGEILTLS
jgi:hypothetical protein